jgi:hypothetical protein
MELQAQTYRFGIYSERPPIFAPIEVPVAEAASYEGAILAVKTLREDDPTSPILGVWDADARAWPLWRWPCPRCGMSATSPGLCGDCLRDVDLGETRSSRLDEEAEIERDRRAEAEHPYEPGWIPDVS